MNVLIVILSLHLATAIQGDSEDDKFALQQQLEHALNTSQNLFALHMSSLQGSDNAVVQCVPVNYALTCENQEPCQNGTSINCTSGYSATFLWTSFDTKTVKGSILFPWAAAGIHVFAFDWAYLCKVLFEEDNSTVSLSLDIVNDTLHCYSKETLTDVLRLFTRKLKGYAEGQKLPSIEGYAIIWDEKEKTEVEEVALLLLFFALPLLSVLALLVMISVGNRLFDWIHENVKDKANYLYLYFWSAQLLALVALIVGVIVLLGNGSGAIVSVWIYIAMIIEAIIAGVIVIRRKKFIPVPLVCGCSCTGSCCHFHLYHANALAFANIFAFLTYLLYSIPSILFAFYVSPSRTIVRLSFFNFAVIVLLVVVSLFLFSLEKLCFLCFCKRRGLRQRNTEGGAEQDPEGGAEQDPEGGPAPSAPLIQLEHISDGSLFTDINPSDIPVVKIRPSSKNICMALVRMVTAFFIVIVATILLLVIGIVVFEQTSDSTHDINEYLTIIPTIVVNVTLWLAGKKDFIPKEFKSLMYDDVEFIKKISKDGGRMKDVKDLPVLKHIRLLGKDKQRKGAHDGGASALKTDYGTL